MRKYDVFISYRREGGVEAARIIRDELIRNGYRVFFDYEALRSGKFNTQLFNRIKECKYFVLICSPGALDRCRNDGDWVRQEIACAIDNEKTIVPVMLRGFAFPPEDELPEEIRQISMYNGVSASDEHFDSYIKKLCGFLRDSNGFFRFLRSTKYNGLRAGITLLAILALAGVGIFGAREYFDVPADFPGTREEIACFQRIVNYEFREFGIYNSAFYRYESALKELKNYCAGTSNHQQFLTLDEFAKKTAGQIADLRAELKTLGEFDPTLIDAATKQIGGNWNVGNTNSLADALRICLSDMETNLRGIAQQYNVVQRNTRDTILHELIEKYAELASRERDLLFLEINEEMLAVKNQTTLTKIKMEYLPALTSLAKDQTWFESKDDIAAKRKILENRQNEILKEIEKLAEKLEAIVRKWKAEIENLKAESLKIAEISDDESVPAGTKIEKIDAQISKLKSQKEIYALQINDKEAAEKMFGEVISVLENRRAELVAIVEAQEKEKKAEEEKRNAEAAREREEVEQKKKFEEAKRRIRNELAPDEHDEIEALWKKSRCFATLKMPDMARRCYEIFAKKVGTEATGTLCEKAAFFVENMEQTNVEKGVIVLGFEKASAKQDFEIGDIIFAVDGNEITLVDDVTNLCGNADCECDVLRFDGNGNFQILKIKHSPSRSRLLLLDLVEKFGE